MTKDEVKKLRMNSPESLQFLNNATKFYNLTWIIHGVAVKVAESHIVTVF